VVRENIKKKIKKELDRLYLKIYFYSITLSLLPETCMLLPKKDYFYDEPLNSSTDQWAAHFEPFRLI